MGGNGLQEKARPSTATLAQPGGKKGIGENDMVAENWGHAAADFLSYCRKLDTFVQAVVSTWSPGLVAGRPHRINAMHVIFDVCI